MKLHLPQSFYVFLYRAVISKRASRLPLTWKPTHPTSSLPVNQDRKLQEQMPAPQLCDSWWVLVLGWICKGWERSEGGPCRGRPAPLPSLSFTALSYPSLFLAVSSLLTPLCFHAPQCGPKKTAVVFSPL